VAPLTWDELCPSQVNRTRDYRTDAAFLIGKGGGDLEHWKNEVAQHWLKEKSGETLPFERRVLARVRDARSITELKGLLLSLSQFPQTPVAAQEAKFEYWGFAARAPVELNLPPQPRTKGMGPPRPPGPISPQERDAARIGRLRLQGSLFADGLERGVGIDAGAISGRAAAGFALCQLLGVPNAPTLDRLMGVMNRGPDQLPVQVLEKFLDDCVARDPLLVKVNDALNALTPAQARLFGAVGLKLELKLEQVPPFFRKMFRERLLSAVAQWVPGGPEAGDIEAFAHHILQVVDGHAEQVQPELYTLPQPLPSPDDAAKLMADRFHLSGDPAWVRSVELTEFHGAALDADPRPQFRAALETLLKDRYDWVPA
jgi:hypothetical protein